MTALIYLSLITNVLVLVPVCMGLMTDAPWAVAAYGEDTPARGILLSVYVAILFVSAGLLLKPMPASVAALLAVQIAYKLTTPVTVGHLAHPVVISNLAIAALHIVTLASIVWLTPRGA